MESVETWNSTHNSINSLRPKLRTVLVRTRAEETRYGRKHKNMKCKYKYTYVLLFIITIEPSCPNEFRTSLKTHGSHVYILGDWKSLRAPAIRRWKQTLGINDRFASLRR